MKKTLDAKNLEALGAERLAELLIEISAGNAAAKRRLRLELAGAQSPAEVAREIRKRLSAIARSRTFVDWQNRRAFDGDLTIPAGANDLSETKSIVGVGFIDLQTEGGIVVVCAENYIRT